MRLKSYYNFTIFILIVIFFWGCKQNQIKEKSFFAADTFFSIKIYQNVDESILNNLSSYIENLANQIDRYNKNSLTYKLNTEGILKNPPKWYIDLLKYSLKFKKLSNGGFDITIGELIDLWGFGSKNPHIPSKEAIKNFLQKKRSILIENNTIKIKNCKIDLGAVGKGFLLEKAKEYLIKKGVNTFLLNFGGNIYGHGNRVYKIGIQVPFEPTGVFGDIIEIKNEAVATSGNYQRYFKKDGKIYCHIFDPLTGYQPHLYKSVTVVTKSPIDSDILSTAIFVRGVLPSFKPYILKIKTIK